MKQYTLIFTFVLISISILNAQNYDFETTLKEYNQSVSEFEELKKMDEHDFLILADEVDYLLPKFQELFKKFDVINNNGGEIKRAAAYYALWCTYQYADVQAYMFDYQGSYKSLSYIKKYINEEINLNLPYYYNFEGTRYEVSRDNFNILKKNYYELMQTNTILLSKYEELKSILNSQITQNNNHSSVCYGLQQLFASNNAKLIEIGNDWYIYYLSSFIISFNQLIDSEATTVLNRKDLTQWWTAVSELNKTAKNSTLTNVDLTSIAEALNSISLKNRHSEDVIDLYNLLIDRLFTTADYNGGLLVFNTKKNIYSFYDSAIQTAKDAMKSFNTGNDNFNQGLDLLNKNEKIKAKRLVEMALIKKADLAVARNECMKIQEAVAEMQNNEMTNDYSKYNNLISTCNVIVKKAEEKRLKEQRKANSKFNIYLGTYPIGLLTKSEKRDYGLAVDFVTVKKNAFEFSFLNIKQKRENYWDIWMMEKKYNAEDLSLWDGFYTHFQYKSFLKYNDNIYNGLLLGYAKKDFTVFKAQITNNQTNIQSLATFDPTENQYILMINEGAMGLYKGYGFDAYIGVGATYNQFNDGNSLLDRTAYTINNNVLQYRKKEYFSFIMRVGITIGLNFGNGNR